jgi:subtilisin family serine protease
MYNYYVVADHPDLKEIIHQDLQSETGSDFVPERSVECTDCQPGSLYNGIFLLTEDEAEILKNDPRIRDVHRIPEEDDIFIKHFGTRAGEYDKSSIVTAAMKNWVLSRCINKTDNFGFSNTITDPYTFNLNGTGVDVILIDSGVEPGHPEFAVNADGTGGSRVIDYDWTQHGLLSVPTGGFLGDCDGHGSNCASIIAGNTCGWAPNAAIYSLRCIGSGAATERSITTGAVLGLLSDSLAWQTIRLFHLAKPIDPATGYRRPTVVNASYGYYRTYPAQLIFINYRGTTYSINTTTNNYGTINIPGFGDTGQYPARVSSIDADIVACIAAGVVVVGAAGNHAHKIDIPTGPDYNNLVFPGSYYHRGCSPGSAPGVICVGSIGSVRPEHKISYSNTGPRVDIFAPGDNIMGVYSSAAFRSAAVQDPRNTAYYLNKIGGTSQAAPQVAGVASLLLQARPWMTATNIMNIITATSAKNLLSETFYWDYDVQANSTAYAAVSTGTYTNLSSLQGAINGYLYMPFNQPITLAIG